VKYCTLDDMQDGMLKKIVTVDDIAEAEEYIDDLAWSVGIDPIRIPKIEVPYKVRKLAVYYALMTVANNKSIMNQRGQDGADAYELKRKVYAAKVDEITKDIKLSPIILLGQKPRSNAFRTIALGRR
jgi:hypothetical protein